MNKGEQRRLYASNLQKIVQKNIKNKISFSINNYNNNNTNNSNNDFENFYRNINQNKTPEGIRILNKSIDISRNKSPSYPLKPSYIIKTEDRNNLVLNNPLCKEYIQANKSVDFTNNSIPFNTFNCKNDDLNNILQGSVYNVPTQNLFRSNK